MTFSKELDFEKAVITLLTSNKWNDVIKNPTEEMLLKNWADIIFENNRGIDRLNDYPLTDGEMGQIIEQINDLRTPYKLNGFINGKTVSIKRDNQDDAAHFGKEVSLKIYDPMEIGAGQSRYQIAEQPKFPTPNPLASDRRGDFMILINGMPLIHVELKRSGVPVAQATNQIEKYTKEGVFAHGLYSLVQIFVAMTPDETLYFANPGFDGKFNKDYFFHWENFNNEPINNWADVAQNLLTIPMAHQITGFYTVADGGDGVLKVMRSYQYYASHAIADKVSKTKWDDVNIRGGYIWHTTGSGKTMTSFKTAQLISRSNDADKVVFLVDRIELGTQSLNEYQGFANDDEEVQATENTDVLVAKLKSANKNDTLIVTSIQKLSRIKEDNALHKIRVKDIELINRKRIVIIVDECHRSTFGEMLTTIKQTFPDALFFGFTGTPILFENKKKDNTTADVFGDELHRYSIADGIRDGNVLGFDPYKVLTFKENDLREAVALEQVHASSVSELDDDEERQELYYHYMNDVPMAGYYERGRYVDGIEDFLPSNQYKTEEHVNAVVDDIISKFPTISRGGKFHAIFATHSIPEAITYYKLLKARDCGLKITALFDQSIDNSEGAYIKEESILEILDDYNRRYGMHFTIPTFDRFKKDVSHRLAHKKAYLNVPRDLQIDILIVVNQMLTGFDSKWVNTLYMDKEMEYESIIQAFSRTNRIFGHDKPFGVIRYYRKPFTMEKCIEEAFRTYSGNRPFGMFVQRLEQNLLAMNALFLEIKDIFSGISDFSRLPDSDSERKAFANRFVRFNRILEAAKVQDFTWSKLEYTFVHEDSSKHVVKLLLDEQTYNTLVARYKELFTAGPGGGGGDVVPYDLEGYITEINTDKINSDYMDTRFKKWLKELNEGHATDELLKELHKTFSVLSQEDQKYANILIGDIQSGNIIIDERKNITEYILDYKIQAQNDRIHRFALAVGVDEEKLRTMVGLHLNESTINEFGRFDDLKESVDLTAAAAYFEKLEGKKVPVFKLKVKVDDILRKFVILGGFDL